jgi:putative ABC transport system ATP-binding protein
MNKESVLELKDVYLSYLQKSGEMVHVLQGISLQIDPDSLTLIVGPAGSGKSSLLRVTGMLENPSEGSIIFKGVNCTNMTPEERSSIVRNELGFIVPYPNLLPYLNALENVMLPMISQDTQKAKKILKNVGITNVNEFPAELYSEERQRVGIARAMINNPSLIFADEPTIELNRQATHNIMEFLENLKEKFTIVVFTDDMKLSKYADKVFKLDNGILFENKV